MKNLVSKLTNDFQQFTFVVSDEFCWSPKASEVRYIAEVLEHPPAQWTLLHELAHGVLGHHSYSSDLELIQLEAAAWETAQELAQTYQLTIDENHIQDCLDTYRDWLYLRSICPRCQSSSLQISKTQYKCFNCTQTWHVTPSRFCRPYRRKEGKQPGQLNQKMTLV